MPEIIPNSTEIWCDDPADIGIIEMPTSSRGNQSVSPALRPALRDAVTQENTFGPLPLPSPSVPEGVVLRSWRRGRFPRSVQALTPSMYEQLADKVHLRFGSYCHEDNRGVLIERIVAAMQRYFCLITPRVDFRGEPTRYSLKRSVSIDTTDLFGEHGASATCVELDLHLSEADLACFGDLIIERQPSAELQLTAGSEVKLNSDIEDYLLHGTILDRFTSFKVISCDWGTGEVLVEPRRQARSNSGPRQHVIPMGLLLNWTSEDQAALSAAVDRVLTPRELDRLNRVGRVLRELWYNYYNSLPFDEVRQKYVELLRGLRSKESVLMTDRFNQRMRATRHTLRGGVHPEEERTESLMERLDRTLKGSGPSAWPRALDDVGNMVGVEAEFVVPRITYQSPNIFGVELVRDGSVLGHTNDYRGGGQGDYDSEARICFKFGDWRRLESACAKLTAAGCVANKTCGLHVHLDMRNRGLPEVRRIARRLAAALPFLNTLVPRSRWDSDHARRYCAQGYSFRNRYHAINGCSFGRRQTLEIRLFSGSLNAGKIRHWVEILRHLAFKHGRLIRTFDDFIADRTAPDHLKEWAKLRRATLYPIRPEPLEVSES